MNLHYRKDLRKFNDPIGPVNPENLFRYYMNNSQKAYELLFDWNFEKYFSSFTDV